MCTRRTELDTSVSMDGLLLGVAHYVYADRYAEGQGGDPNRTELRLRLRDEPEAAVVVLNDDEVRALYRMFELLYVARNLPHDPAEGRGREG